MYMWRIVINVLKFCASSWSLTKVDICVCILDQNTVVTATVRRKIYVSSDVITEITKSANNKSNKCKKELCLCIAATNTVTVNNMQCNNDLYNGAVCYFVQLH